MDVHNRQIPVSYPLCVCVCVCVHTCVPTSACVCVCVHADHVCGLVCTGFTPGLRTRAGAPN